MHRLTIVSIHGLPVYLLSLQYGEIAVRHRFNEALAER